MGRSSLSPNQNAGLFPRAGNRTFIFLSIVKAGKGSPFPAFRFLEPEKLGSFFHAFGDFHAEGAVGFAGLATGTFAGGNVESFVML